MWLHEAEDGTRGTWLLPAGTFNEADWPWTVRGPSLILRPHDESAQHEVCECRHLDEERLGLAFEPLQAA